MTNSTLRARIGMSTTPSVEYGRSSKRTSIVARVPYDRGHVDQGGFLMNRRLVVCLLAVVVLVGLLAAGGSAAVSSRSAAAGPIQGKLRAGAGTVLSLNWSGYAATGATFTD